MKHLLAYTSLSVLALLCLGSQAFAQYNQKRTYNDPVPARSLQLNDGVRELLKARAEVNWRYGQVRSILMSEFWIPIAQSDNRVVFASIRLMGDDNQNREGNLGLGIRDIVSLPKRNINGVLGFHGWLDRRITKRGSEFNQFAFGAEWLGQTIDIRANGYIPLSDAKTYENRRGTPSNPYLAGTGIFVDTADVITEEPQYGADIEIGVELGQFSGFIRSYTDALRVFVGGYYFEGSKTENIAGWTTRISADITEDVELGARFQRDDERGSQGFLEATIRFPWGSKRSFREHGVYARLDESPERDIDIITGETTSGNAIPIVNINADAAQTILHVDNTAEAGGNGSIDSPFNTLSAAESAATANSIIYIHRGDGTTTGQNAGFTFNNIGQKLIGSGANLTLTTSDFRIADGTDLSALPTTTLISATTAPVITNTVGNGIDISSLGGHVEGITIDGATSHGISITANDNSMSNNVTIENTSVTNNGGNGIVLNNMLNSSSFTEINIGNATLSNNTFHGIIVSIGDSASIDNINISNTTSRLHGNNGIQIGTGDNSEISQINISDTNLQDNARRGLYFRYTGDSNIGSMRVENLTSNNSGREGLFLLIQNNATAGTMYLQDSIITNSANEGIQIEDNSTNDFTTIDIGGGALGSTGGNSSFGNTGVDLYADLDGDTLKAENNWWGNPAGLQPGRFTEADGSSIDATPFLNANPNP